MNTRTSHTNRMRVEVARPKGANGAITVADVLDFADELRRVGAPLDTELESIVSEGLLGKFERHPHLAVQYDLPTGGTK